MAIDDIYYLVVSGGTMSGLGKGMTMSNIGIVMKCLGWNVTAIKIDPYLNVDAGTMSPFEHGEVFVLEDGGEVDLDLGNYERLLDIALTRDHNITSGKIFRNVIERERKGEYLGKTVEVVPHVTDAVQEWICRVAQKSRKPGVPSICMIEVGGTVGDIESSIYFEALQQLSTKMKGKFFCMCHLAFVPILTAEGQIQFKTKPCQHSIRTLRQAGLNPDFIFCRSEKMLDDKTQSKISVACCVDKKCVISVPNVEQLYEMPSILHYQHLDQLLCEKFELNPVVPPPSNGDRIAYTFDSWERLARSASSAKESISIGLVAKYVATTDTYKSVVEALKHAANACGHRLDINWIDAEKIELTAEEANSALIQDGIHGILCPGGFGRRGTQGKIYATKYCRENGIPFFGICLGMQIAVIEFARNVLQMPDADSEEFSKTADPCVVIFMPEIDSEYLGGTMCLGSRETRIHDTNSLAFKLYESSHLIHERHRHRYEVNPELVTFFEDHGLKFSGRDERGRRMEIAELRDHPFFFCTQFHPEFTSRPTKPNPCFLAFIQAAIDHATKSKSRVS